LEYNYLIMLLPAVFAKNIYGIYW